MGKAPRTWAPADVDDKLSEIEPEQKTATLQIPLINKLTVKSIDRFREMSLARMSLERDR